MNNILEHLKIFLFFFPKHVFQLAKGYWEKKRKTSLTSNKSNIGLTSFFRCRILYFSPHDIVHVDHCARKKQVGVQSSLHHASMYCLCNVPSNITARSTSLDDAPKVPPHAMSAHLVAPGVSWTGSQDRPGRPSRAREHAASAAAYVNRRSTLNTAAAARENVRQIGRAHV